MLVARCSLLVALLCGLVASTALAYVHNPAIKWPGQVSFYIDAQSASNINGHAVSANEFAYWVAYAFGEWKHRSGADLSFDYKGGLSNSNCENPFQNVVGVKPGCSTPFTCEENARTTCNISSSGEITSCSICIYGGSADWELQKGNVSSGEVDLVGILVHEAGHFLGIIDEGGVDGQGHYHGTAMKPGPHSGAFGRYITGGDIEGIRAKYGVRLRPRYAAELNASLGSSVPIAYHPPWGGIGAWQRTDGALGYRSDASGMFLVSSATNADGTRQYFRRHNLPLNPSTATSKYIGASSWTTPAVEANWLNGSNARWMAAWFEKSDKDSCCTASSILRVFRSTDAFSSAVDITPSSVPIVSFYKPTITYHPQRNIWYILWIAADFASGGNGDIKYIRSSNHGTTRSAVHNLGIGSIDTPDMDCATDCVITYARATSDIPTTVARRLTVNTAGDLVLQGWKQTLPATFHTPTIGMRNPGGPPYSGESVIARTTATTGDYDLIAEGGGRLSYTYSSGLPPAIDTLPWTWTGYTHLAHPAAVLSFTSLSTAYLLFTY